MTSSDNQVAYFSAIELAAALIVIMAVVFTVSYCLLSRRMRLPGVNIHDLDHPIAAGESGLPDDAVAVVVDSTPKLTVVWSKEKLGSELGKNWSCSVCLGENENDDALRVLPECRHVFHRACLDSWLRLRATCPLCRKSPSAVVCISVVASLPPAVPASPV